MPLCSLVDTSDPIWETFHDHWNNDASEPDFLRAMVRVVDGYCWVLFETDVETSVNVRLGSFEVDVFPDLEDLGGVMFPLEGLQGNLYVKVEDLANDILIEIEFEVFVSDF